jgi:hypothetical protein
MTVVSILGGWSAFLILGDMNNLQVPSGPINTNFDITDPDNMYIEVPFNITNAGYFDLTFLRIQFKIAMVYDHINLTTPGENVTTSALIFDKSIDFPDIRQGTTYSGIFNASSGDGFLSDNFPNATTEIDWYRTPYAIEFYSNFTVSASYSLNLISFSVDTYNVSVGHFP